MTPRTSLRSRTLGRRGGELVHDRLDGLLELLLVLRLVVRNRRNALTTPQQGLGLRVEHIDDHGPFGVLRHRRSSLDSPVAAPATTVAASPAAPPVRPPRDRKSVV